MLHDVDIHPKEGKNLQNKYHFLNKHMIESPWPGAPLTNVV